MSAIAFPFGLKVFRCRHGNAGGACGSEKPEAETESDGRSGNGCRIGIAGEAAVMFQPRVLVTAESRTRDEQQRAE